MTQYQERQTQHPEKDANAIVPKHS